ncbi:5-carboxymethyl-2-hydroxymuconate Delta-isomerase [Paraburkholderia sp. Ac-20347]|uniref:5-carboxymethyl-2-hydroxymuconate Delta-isomerase n=1 Tax=Paraburkholderia sp. Ac-20347 TaxID=2703892 RepID=UPI0019812D4E|nr:5-carboxymethyl-2-hydroxymuconate Delta-isomerase [Paraburkholderia sp. Ac-20347]MBN3809944.1 5-carboxymethyl-2-hydroxymuconate Delta-isomerase [Paraburkholderia sp. Ac-20347]
MPHLVILYNSSLDRHVDMSALCRQLADTMLAQRDEFDQPLFPPGGTRVFAYPAPHFAIGDGGIAGRVANGIGEYNFAYLNLRMGRGRSEAVQQRVGQDLKATARAHFEPLLATYYVGVTLQIDVGAEVFDAKLSNIHPLFNRG